MPVEKTERFILFNALILFGLGVFLGLVNEDYFHHVYTAEDGLLEWLTVLALGAVAVVLAGRLWKYRRSFNWRQRSVLAALVVLATFGAGEEISWGQRLLGIETSEFFLDHNRQQEINLHNLVVGDLSVNKDIFSKGILLIFLVYLGVIKPLVPSIRSHRAPGRQLGHPDPQTIPVSRLLARNRSCGRVGERGYRRAQARGAHGVHDSGSRRTEPHLSAEPMGTREHQVVTPD